MVFLYRYDDAGCVGRAGGLSSGSGFKSFSSRLSGSVSGFVDADSVFGIWFCELGLWEGALSSMYSSIMMSGGGAILRKLLMSLVLVWSQCWSMTALPLTDSTRAGPSHLSLSL